MAQQGKMKKWVAPELLVLVRSHSEEAVLAACKWFFVPALSANYADNACNATTDICGGGCAEIALS